MTAEHAWPQWIAKYLPAQKLQHISYIEREGEDTAVRGQGERVPFTTTVRCVCKPCNEGWMHEMEGTAEHLLAPLIQGKPVVWHEWKQSLAATWAFKTAIVLEQSNPSYMAIPPEIYPLFRQFQCPAPFSQIWMAHYDGEFPHSFGSGAMRLLIRSAEGEVIPNDLEAYGASLHVGALAFRIYGHLIKNGPADIPSADMEQRLTPIWPISPRVRWPPEQSIDDDGLELLVKSMGVDLTGPESQQSA